MLDVKLTEPVFGQDDFRRPKILRDGEALVQTILIILFGKPGFFPSIPELGMDIRQYRYVILEQFDTTEITTQLAYQCSLLQQPVATGDIQVRKEIVVGRPALLFIIPCNIESRRTDILVGVKFNKNNIGYHYDLMAASDAIEKGE